MKLWKDAPSNVKYVLQEIKDAKMNKGPTIFEGVLTALVQKGKIHSLWKHRNNPFVGALR